jgi:ligand-binding SRPBCC domain-containing protein
MPRLEIETTIDAPAERCFDLARDLDLHLQSMQASGERAIGGRTSGLIEMGEEVTWEARHFGLSHQHCSRITAFTRPQHFRDSMVRGRFKKFEHDHYFVERDGRTVMRDVIEFASPLGLIGRFVDVAFLSRYLRRLIMLRNRVIQEAAETQRGPSNNELQRTRPAQATEPRR